MLKHWTHPSSPTSDNILGRIMEGWRAGLTLRIRRTDTWFHCAFDDGASDFLVPQTHPTLTGYRPRCQVRISLTRPQASWLATLEYVWDDVQLACGRCGRPGLRP